MNSINNDLPDDLLFDTLGESNSAGGGGGPAVSVNASSVGGMQPGQVQAPIMVSAANSSVVVSGANSVVPNGVMQPQQMRPQGANPNINLVTALTGNKMGNGPAGAAGGNMMPPTAAVSAAGDMNNGGLQMAPVRAPMGQMQPMPPPGGQQPQRMMMNPQMRMVPFNPRQQQVRVSE